MTIMTPIDKADILKAVNDSMVDAVDGGVMVSVYVRSGLQGFQDCIFKGTASDLNLSNVREIVDKGNPLKFQRGCVASPGDVIEVRVKNGTKLSSMVSEDSHIELFCDCKTEYRSGPIGSVKAGYIGLGEVATGLSMVKSEPICISSAERKSLSTWRASTYFDVEETIFTYTVPSGYYLVFDPKNPVHHITGHLMSQEHKEHTKISKPIELKSPFKIEIVEKKERKIWV